MNLTYRQLQEFISNMDPVRLDDNVTVYDGTAGEYRPVSGCEIVTEDDVLDAGHPVLVVE